MSNLILSIIITIVSIVTLVVAATWVLKGAVSVARHLGISPLIIGTTVVAMGTILPSVIVNLVVLFFSRESIDIGIGNMIGTNYVNLGLALGIPAFMTTIVTKYEVFEKEIPLYLGITALFSMFAADKLIGQSEGLVIILAYMLIAFVIYQYAKRERANGHQVGIVEDQEAVDMRTGVGLVMLGVVTLTAASFGLVYAAPILSRIMGMSDYVMGLTVVGIGTSLPTIVASVEAVKKGYVDIVLGNVFGGNIINIGIGIGLPALFRSLPLSTQSVEDVTFITIYNFIILIAILIEMRLLGGNKSLSRLSGLLIIMIYVGYLATRIFGL